MTLMEYMAKLNDIVTDPESAIANARIIQSELSKDISELETTKNTLSNAEKALNLANEQVNFLRQQIPDPASKPVVDAQNNPETNQKTLADLIIHLNPFKNRGTTSNG